jgi:glycosyltransferase involved in cell wall biosynthesis
MNMEKPRVAWLLTHRIQYFTNLLETLHVRGQVAPSAIYAFPTGNLVDEGFGRRIEWDNRTETGFPESYLRSTGVVENKRFLSSLSARLPRMLDRLRPQYLYLNGYTDAIAWEGFLWACKARVPFAIRCDGDTLTPRNPFKAAVRRRLAAAIVRRAHRVHYQGRENRKFWIENGANEEQLTWVPCVADTEIYGVEAFAGEEERRSFRAELEAAPGELVAVVSGKLIPRKRPEDALRALAELKDAPVRVWFLGSGELESELKRMAAELGVADRIAWLGFRNQSELPRILQAADVLLHPSSFDPWPYSILEGARSGLALLLSDKTGSHPDWFAAPEAGMAFPCGDWRTIAECLRRWTEIPTLLEAQRRNAFARACEYSEETFCRIFEENVFSALNTKSAAA